MHVAHAPPPVPYKTEASRAQISFALGLGIFDISFYPSALALSLLLERHYHHLIQSAQTASQPRPVDGVVSSVADGRMWRIDLIHRDEKIGLTRGQLRKRVEAWLMGCAVRCVLICPPSRFRI